MVDVRGPGETAAGTLPGAREIPLPSLTDSLDALDRARPVVVYCAGGYRSQVAASVLRHAGYDDVSDVLGGYGAWAGAGMPVSHGGEADPIDIPDVTAVKANVLVTAGAPFLDVREHDEWCAGHVAGASLVPMGQVRARLGEVDSSRRFVIMCRSGGRSAAVTQALRSLGLDAVNLAGGIRAWAAAGLPVVTDEGDPGR